MSWWPIRQLGDAVEAALFVEARGLEVVGQCENKLTTTSDCFRNEGLKQSSPYTGTSVTFVYPKLFNLGHTSPTVTGNRTYLVALGVRSHEPQPFAIIPARCTAVMSVKSIL